MSDKKKSTRSAPDDGASYLTQERAFVVQVSRDGTAPGGRLGGRIEHVTSGERAPFRSLREMATFSAGVLERLDNPIRQEPTKK